MALERSATQLQPEGKPSRLRALLSRLMGSEQPAADHGAAMPRAGAPVDPVIALLEVVFAGFPEPVIAIDDDLRIAAFNAPASAIVPALYRGEPALVMLRTPELVEGIRRAKSTRAPQYVEFLQRIPVDRWFEVSVEPIAVPDAAGQVRNMLLLTFKDLTPLRRVEAMRTDFVANASHELRTPLAALLGFIETLQGSAKDDPKARERFLDIMKKQATRMARLIDDLLSLSRIELNAHVQPDTPVELAPLVRQVVDGLQTLARDRDVEIRVDAQPEALTVLADRDELLRALENLVENATKYGSAGKRVEISLTAAAGEARIVVRDFGPGIEPAHLPRLTERFYRVDIADSRAQGGTGLGLALVKHVLNHHNGRLTIESRPGAGATFTMHLPLRTETSGETPKTA